jgi:hypothetical protein
VHAVVSRTVRFCDPMGARRATLGTALVESLIDVLDGGRDSGDYQQLTDYLPHVAEVAGEGADADQRYARNEAAGAYVGMGRLEEACEVFGALYRVCQERLGDRDPTTLAALVGVGAVEGLRGRYRAALELKTITLPNGVCSVWRFRSANVADRRDRPAPTRRQ